MAPRRIDRSPRHLSIGEREEISRGLSEDLPYAEIGRRLQRHTSTISREVAANGGRHGYRAWSADARASRLARRPKPSVFERSARLVAYVTKKLRKRWSPRQISASLIKDYPYDLEMRVSHETIYQALFVQGRGTLRKELAKYLRSGRTTRKARGGTTAAVNPSPLRQMVSISDRPAEVDDRAVPGHWEGDLIIGAHNQSAVATLVERTTRFTMLGALPDGRTADKVRDVLAQLVARLPVALRRSLTWDQGREMADHTAFTVASGVQVYFCDPHSPWQRGSNENTNGLLRQYMPKGTDLSHHTQADLDAIADELNGRPRQTLNWMTPSEAFNQLVATAA
jgi:IS30 family transposase